jgi:YHS domain-containing protein
MSKAILFALLSAGLVFVAALTGCSQQQSGDQSSPPTNTSSNDSAMAGHEGHDHAAGGEMAHDESGTSKYEDALAKLSPADRELAEKQKVCPVSGEPLGAMGTPYKVTVKDREVFLCCPGCESKIKENPDQYLAKLDH